MPGTANCAIARRLDALSSVSEPGPATSHSYAVAVRGGLTTASRTRWPTVGIAGTADNLSGEPTTREATIRGRGTAVVAVRARRVPVRWLAWAGDTSATATNAATGGNRHIRASIRRL